QAHRARIRHSRAARPRGGPEWRAARAPPSSGIGRLVIAWRSRHGALVIPVTLRWLCSRLGQLRREFWGGGLGPPDTGARPVISACHQQPARAYGLTLPVNFLACERRLAG